MISFYTAQVAVFNSQFINKKKFWAMVVAQLEELSLLIPEVSSSTPVIGKIFNERLFTVNCIEKTKMEKKVTGNVPFLQTKKFRGNCIDGFFSKLVLSLNLIPLHLF